MLKRRYPIHLLLVVILLLLQVCVYPANVFGADKDAPLSNPTSAKPALTLDQAVQIVKNNFSIPEKYTRLTTGYNDFNNRATYSINWNSVEQPGGSFHAEVDANTGDILNVYTWEQPTKPSFKVPVLSAAEAEKAAIDLVAKLAGNHQSEMQLVKDEQQVFAFNNYEPFTYNFRWIRMVNGIPFPGNGVNVSVRGDNGQIRNYNFNWTRDLTFPEASNVITPEKARQVFTDTPVLELQYYLPPIMNPQTPEPQRVLLVYQLSNKYYGGAIDALSGKPVTLDPQMGIYRPMDSTGTASTALSQSIEAVPSDAKSIVPEPGNSVQISRDEAVEVVKKMITIPEDLVLRNASLNQDWQNPGEQVWNLDWNSQPTDMVNYRFLNARVNAKTGDFIGFSLSPTRNPDDKTDPITREAAQKVADEFLARVQPERFKLVKVDTANPYMGKTPSNMQSFNYVRMVNGIPVSRNGMNITVDTVAKQVMNYGLTWSNVEFPSPSNLLSLNQATDRFLKERPLALNYVQMFQQNGQQDVRLVYQPKNDYSSYLPMMLDAATGDPLDWYGKSQTQWVKPHYYTDIEGNFAEKEIGLLGLTGAFGEYGEAFRPDEKVTVGALFRAMLTAEGNGRDRVLTNDDVLKMAKDRGWFSEDLKPDAELSRENLSKIMIRLINMETAAQVKGIYFVPFRDVYSLSQDSLGYIALSWGLGILRLDGLSVEPNKSVTRAEAAYALVHAYAVERPLNR